MLEGGGLAAKRSAGEGGCPCPAHVGVVAALEGIGGLDECGKNRRGGGQSWHWSVRASDRGKKRAPYPRICCQSVRLVVPLLKLIGFIKGKYVLGKNPNEFVVNRFD